jgi:uncharacterized protein YdaU (DUF1376 family)
VSNPLEWFPFYPKDWLSDPAISSSPLAVRAIYLNLLCYQWETGRLPQSDVELSLLGNCHRKLWNRHKERILSFFKVDENGFYYNERLEEERRKSISRRALQVEKGLKGGRPQESPSLATAFKPKSRGFSPAKPQAKPSQSPLGGEGGGGGEEGVVTTEINNISGGDTCTEGAARFTPDGLVQLWNESAERLGLRECKKLTTGRTIAARQRLTEEPSRDYWMAVISRIGESEFCRGIGDRGWIANFDFLVRPSTHVKVIEGVYDNGKTNGKGSRTAGNAQALRNVMAYTKAVEDGQIIS